MRKKQFVLGQELTGTAQFRPAAPKIICCSRWNPLVEVQQSSALICFDLL